MFCITCRISRNQDSLGLDTSPSWSFSRLQDLDINCHNLGIDQQSSHGLGTNDRLRSRSGRRMEKSSSCWSSILKVPVSDGLEPVFHQVIGQHSLSGDCGPLCFRLQSSFIDWFHPPAVDLRVGSWPHCQQDLWIWLVGELVQPEPLRACGEEEDTRENKRRFRKVQSNCWFLNTWAGPELHYSGPC